MNFFEHQHEARKRTKYLVVLFILAVLLIIFAVSLLFTLIWIIQLSTNLQLDRDLWPTFFIVAKYVAPITAFTVALVSQVRMLTLSGSGRKVALFLGASPLDLTTKDASELRLKNVVEEMAIASGMPVPEIFILEHETSINAFAAGMDSTQAAIGVTRGALEQLTREELQGVIAHEFSHIFNGDSRLNVNLMGWLAGITFLTTAGRVILDGSRRAGARASSSRRGNNGAGAIIFLGLGLLVIGSIGTFFASWIKAALSRQREFLADASAVQFTRNPEGLSGALSKIAREGSAIKDAHSQEASHLFFGSVKEFYLLATHPPLAERLKRLGMVQLSPTKAHTPRAHAVSRIGNPGAQDFVIAAAALAQVAGQAEKALGHPDQALRLVMALLAEDSELEHALGSIDRLELREQIRTSTPRQRLNLVELAIPALKRLSPEQLDTLFLATTSSMHDGAPLRPLEVAMHALLRRHLMPRAKRVSSERLRNLKTEAHRLLKMIALAGHQANPSEARHSFGLGSDHLLTPKLEADQLWTTLRVSASHIIQSLESLSRLTPLDKGRLFEAMWITVQADRKLEADEFIWIKALSETLEIPLPPSAL